MEGESRCNNDTTSAVVHVATAESTAQDLFLYLNRNKQQRGTSAAVGICDRNRDMQEQQRSIISRLIFPLIFGSRLDMPKTSIHS